MLLRQVFQVASSCPVEALYLELGCVPLGITIKGRRIKYLHHLLSREDTEMISKFFYSQWKYPASRNEWTEQVKKDMEEFKIEGDIEWIKSKTKSSFKTFVKQKAKEVAAETLKQIKETHSKMDNLKYSDLDMQMYLMDDAITTSQARALFRFRTRMARFWENFKGGRSPEL